MIAGGAIAQGFYLVSILLALLTAFFLGVGACSTTLCILLAITTAGRYGIVTLSAAFINRRSVHAAFFCGIISLATAGRDAFLPLEPPSKDLIWRTSSAIRRAALKPSGAHTFVILATLTSRRGQIST